MKFQTALLFSLFCYHTAFGQELPGVLEGLVLKEQSQTPLRDANVLLVGTTRGDATDQEGYFRIEQIPPGDYEIEVRLIGYAVKRQKIRIRPAETQRVIFNLAAQLLEGDEVTIQAERVADVRLEISPPTFELSQKELQEAPGSLEDVMRSIFSLPGVHSTSDFSNQFIVRGGGPDQNLVLMDDVEIVNPYRNSGMPSLINPDVIKDVNLYAGGYPALFGDRLSSVLAVHTRDGTTGKWLSGQLGMNTINRSMVFEGKIPIFRGSWLISDRRTYNQFFAQSYVERLTGNNVALPDFADRFIKVTLNPTISHQLQFHTTKARNNQNFLISQELGEQDAEREDFDGEDNIETDIIGGSWNYTSANLQAKLYGNRSKSAGNSNFAGDFIPSIDRSLVIDGFEPPSVFSGGDSTFLFSHNQAFSISKVSLGGWSVFERGRHILESGLEWTFWRTP